MTSRPLAGPATAKDAEQMRALFEQRIRSHSGPSFDVLGCTVGAVREQQGRSWFQYTLRLRDAGSGRERDLRLNGLVGASDQSRQAAQNPSLGQPGPAPGDEPLPLPAFSYLSELDMVVQVFPHDLRLPALAPLLKGAFPDVEPFLLARFGPGDWTVDEWRGELVQYRIEMQATVRLTLRVSDAATDRTAERRFYAKVYHWRRHAKQQALLLQELAKRTGGAFAIGRPIGFSGRAGMQIQEEVAGTSLLDLLRSDGDATGALRRVARAVAALHRLDLKPLGQQWRRDRIAGLETVQESMRARRPDLAAEIDETARAVVDGLADGVSAPVHGDLKPEHILLDGDHVGFIDWDLCALADPLSDAANLLFKLRREGGRLAGRPDR
ncbi:MAG: aminoglycoside phosphotransferase family protein, partial [Chloroflexia bacterium]|nr:aminoglycoside phosphotransferase family protein [Chloroflexia bacterium]